MTELPTKSIPVVALSIAGFDPSSGAGITADIKTFAAHGVYGVSCATALTVQSTQGVRRTVPVGPELVAETLNCLADDLEIAGIKIGMLANGPVARVVGEFLEKCPISRDTIVLDPVLRSSSGAALLDEAGVSGMRESLLAHVGWITPNLDELAVLTGVTAITRDIVPDSAQRLLEMAWAAGNPHLTIIVTGGHLDSPDDYLLRPGMDGVWMTGARVETTSTHGTGCAFSSAILCTLLEGRQGLEAVAAAKHYVEEALRAAVPIGKGHGPMQHFFRT